MAGHYEVLGVAPSAPADEVRRAYLALARRHHPDALAGASPDALAEAGRRMRAINAAWAVLGDPARRAAYDALVARAVATGAAGTDRPGAFDPDTLAAFLLPDPPPAPSTGADLVTLVPAVLTVVALVAVALSMILASPTLLALGLGGFVLGGAAFAVTPLLVMARSRRRPS